MKKQENKLATLKKLIEKRSIFRNKAVTYDKRKFDWYVDLRKVILDPEGLEITTGLLSSMIKNTERGKKFCLGCLTMAADPLIGSLMLNLSRQCGWQVNGFLVRKDRKKYGLQNQIEGNLKPRNAVILIDDVINTGDTLKRTIQIVERHGGSVRGIYVILDLMENADREYFRQKKITVRSIFSATSFSYDVSAKQRGFLLSHPRGSVATKKPPISFSRRLPSWTFEPLNVTAYTACKSSPIKKGRDLYVGSDSGKFYSIDARSGLKKWEYNTGWSGKGIHATPVYFKGSLYFGSYNGYFYSLDAEKGKLLWKKKICSGIGSSPAISTVWQTAYFGTEYLGRVRDRGGIVCVDLKNGAVRWHVSEKNFVHCSPCLSASEREVFIGSNEGIIYCLDAFGGALKWKKNISIGKPGYQEIKGKIVLTPDKESILFGSMNGKFYSLKASNGWPLWSFAAAGPIYFFPLVAAGRVVFGSHDKHIYCLDVKTGKKEWDVEASGELQGGACVVGKAVLVGDLAGGINVIDFRTGKMLKRFMTDDMFSGSPCADGSNVYMGNAALSCWDLSDF